MIFIMKNTSFEGKNTVLISLLQVHFKGELNLAKVKLIFFIYNSFMQNKDNQFYRLTSGFDNL